MLKAESPRYGTRRYVQVLTPCARKSSGAIVVLAQRAVEVWQGVAMRCHCCESSSVELPGLAQGNQLKFPFLGMRQDESKDAVERADSFPAGGDAM